MFRFMTPSRWFKHWSLVFYVLSSLVCVSDGVAAFAFPGLRQSAIADRQRVLVSHAQEASSSDEPEPQSQDQVSGPSSQLRRER